MKEQNQYRQGLIYLYSGYCTSIIIIHVCIIYLLKKIGTSINILFLCADHTWDLRFKWCASQWIFAVIDTDDRVRHSYKPNPGVPKQKRVKPTSVMKLMRTQRQQAKSSNYVDSVTVDVEMYQCKKPAECSRDWIPELGLSQSDRDTLLNPVGWVTDSVVDASQKLLKWYQVLNLSHVASPWATMCNLENWFKFWTQETVTGWLHQPGISFPEDGGVFSSTHYRIAIHCKWNNNGRWIRLYWHSSLRLYH